MTFTHRVVDWLTPPKVLIITVLLCCVMTGATFAASLVQFNSYKAGQQHTEQVARQQGESTGRKLCLSLAKLSSLQPPPGDPAGNPSRFFEQQLHQILAELGPDIGCTSGGIQ